MYPMEKKNNNNDATGELDLIRELETINFLLYNSYNYGDGYGDRLLKKDQVNKDNNNCNPS